MTKYYKYKNVEYSKVKNNIIVVEHPFVNTKVHNIVYLKFQKSR